MNEELKVIISAEVSKLKKGVSEAKGEIRKFTDKASAEVDKVKKSFSGIGDAASKGMKGIGAVTGSVAAFTGSIVAITEGTEEFRVGQAKLETAFKDAGGSAKEATKTYDDLYRVLGDSDVTVEASNHLAQMTTNQKELSQWTTICEGVYATFGDSLPIEGLTEAANETAKVGKVTGTFADALNWVGVSEDDFNAKLEACNSEAEREKLIRETLNGLYGDAAEGYEETAADILAQNDAQNQLNQNLSRLGEILQPVQTAIIDLGNAFLEGFLGSLEDANVKIPDFTKQAETFGKVVGDVLTFIGEHMNIIAPIAGILLGIAAAMAVVNAAIAIHNALMLLNPTVVIITAIIAAIILLIANWDKVKETVSNVAKVVKEKVSNMKEAVAEKFEAIKTTIKEKIQGAKEIVSNIFENIKTTIQNKIDGAKKVVSNGIEAIKKKFNFKWSLPKLKLPHFKATGSFSLNPPKAPHFSVSWYAKGGVFDSPKIFGYGNNQLGGLGENGAEAVVPLEKNTQWLDRIADRLSGNNETSVILQLDGKTLAQTTINAMNSLARQKGRLPLRIQ